jgi:hypothetical protein
VRCARPRPAVSRGYRCAGGRTARCRADPDVELPRLETFRAILTDDLVATDHRWAASVFCTAPMT